MSQKELFNKIAKRVGIWIRVSTEDQARGDSPEHHERRARYYAESKGWTVVEVYHLEAFSGKSVMNYAETKRMMEDVKKDHITGLIFSKLARLARNTRELLEFSDYFQEHNADLISLQESIDTSTPAGRLFYTMIAALAQWEREEIADRVAASVPIRAKLGKHLGGKAPYGYQWVEGKMEPHPDEAPVRKLIYELFLEHRRKKTVAKILNDRGYRTRTQTKFSDTAVERLIRDTTAKGLHRANYSKNVDGNKKCVIKPEEEWVFRSVESIVSEEVWEKCNAILDARRRTKKAPSKRTVHLFAGYAFCECGEKMYPPSNSPKYICKKCRNKIPIPDLEKVFYEQLKSYFLSPQEMSLFIQSADETLHSKEELLGVLQKEEERLEREMDHIYHLYLNGELTSRGFGEKHKPLEERRYQIQDQLPELQAEIDFLKINYLSTSQIIEDARDLYSRWGQMNREEKRHVIENITEKITIGKDEISIDLCYLHPSPEVMARRQHINIGC